MFHLYTSTRACRKSVRWETQGEDGWVVPFSGCGGKTCTFVFQFHMNGFGFGQVHTEISLFMLAIDPYVLLGVYYGVVARVIGGVGNGILFIGATVAEFQCEVKCHTGAIVFREFVFGSAAWREGVEGIPAKMIRSM